MSRLVTLTGYAVIVVAAAIFEMRARRKGTATAGDALGLVMRNPFGRVLVCAAWLWLGWHVFVRVGER